MPARKKTMSPGPTKLLAFVTTPSREFFHFPRAGTESPWFRASAITQFSNGGTTNQYEIFFHLGMHAKSVRFSTMDDRNESYLAFLRFLGCTV